jgi:hypothetical protein
MLKFLVSFFDERSPEDDIKRAFIAGSLCWVVTLILSFFVQYIWVDLVILSICLYGLHKQNKYAATFLFLFYTGSKVFFMIETGRFTGIWSLIFIYLFYKGMVAAFHIHSDDPGITIPEVIEKFNSDKCPKCKSTIDPSQKRCFGCGASLILHS